MAKSPDTEKVVITRLLVQRREFWYAVLAGIAAVVIVVLAVLWLYPELLSEIVDVWDDEPKSSYVSPRLLEPYGDDVWCLPARCASSLPTPTVTQ